MKKEPQGMSIEVKDCHSTLLTFPDEIVIATDSAEGHRVHQQLIGQLKEYDFDEREVFGISLALEEAIVNAMKHGNQFDRAKQVRVAYRFERTPVQTAFYVRIVDEGEGFNPEDVPDPTLEENLERPCGRGLMLMRHYMDEIRFFGKGNVVVMCKRRGEAG
jgi:serine/threonine-protein kinase RsbW